ncbi:MAG: PIG-L family deacetylase [Opitutae bacterium]|nr:PIG-L family deacetylase [Opitutae bacterium]
MKTDRILIVAAHPDDEVLGCGGTIARLATEGAAVTILILANGLSSRPDFDPVRDAPLMKLHHERAQRAGALLGAREVVLAGFPDQKMDTVPLLDITQTIEREIARVQPEIVFTQHGGDLNQDHVLTFRATLAATRPMAGHPVRRVYAYEVGSSTEWAFQQFEPVFRPQVFFDITAHLETKIAAMQVYESEARAFPHPRSPEAQRAQAQRWGSTVGVHAAEAFACIRDLR